MPRTIIRYSINGEGANQTGNSIRVAAAGYGIERVGTGALEGEGSLQDMIDTLREVLDNPEKPPGGGEVDHLRVYLDNPPPAPN